MRLDVHVRGKPVAKLYRDRDEYVLQYLPAATPEDFISLTMPVREEPWKWPRDLHPFFRQNLPEGYLLNVIREEFGPLLDGTDLSLLAVVGGTGIGRVTVTPEGAASDMPLEPFQVDTLLTADNTAEHFSRLVRRYAKVAISGAVPKFLAPEIREAGLVPLGKSTLRTSRHIIKGSDENTPYLGFNEFYSMRVLERLRVTAVARTRMSADGRALVVDRFDIDPKGRPFFGVEDICGLLGLPPQEKYRSTQEEVLKVSKAYLPRAHIRAQSEQFGWHMLTNYVVRNADCHTKNIALYYESLANVRFTPVYDIVTTQAYPRYADNPPGLSVGGRKTWSPGKAMEQFFSGRLGISTRRYAEMVEQLCESAVTTGREVIEAARNETRWHDVARQMVHAWNDGMESLRSPRGSIHLRGLTAAIEEANFSPPEPPVKPPVIGRSELLAKRSRPSKKSG